MKSWLKQQTIGGSGKLAAFVLRTVLAFILFAAAFPGLAAGSTNSPSAYAQWIKPWAARPGTSSAPGGGGLKLIVTTVRGEAALSVVTNMTPLERLYLSYHIQTTAAEVATNGNRLCYYASNTDVKTDSPSRLTAEQLKQLDQWLAQLPEDRSQLPPPGQRVVVQVLKKGQWLIRVYDGAKLPPTVKSICTLLDNPFDKIH